MSKQDLRRFIREATDSSELRSELVSAGPEKIIQIAEYHGFHFSDEIKGRFLNRWFGVYFCPDREDVDRVCPGLKPEGYPSLAHYSQSTCKVNRKEEEFDFRSGNRYFNS